MWSVRYDSKGNLKNGKPCSHCKKCLLKYGFQNIIYSDDQGNLIKTKIKTLNSRNSSGHL